MASFLREGAQRPFVDNLLRLDNSMLIPNGSAFVWNETTVVSCAHVQPQRGSLLFTNRNRELPEVTNVVTFHKQDVAFLFFDEPHGLPAAPCLHTETLTGLSLNVFRERLHEGDCCGVRVLQAKVIAEEEQVELYFNKIAGKTHPVVMRYELPEETFGGTSGSPVLTDKGEIAGMHVGYSITDGHGFAVSVAHINALYQKVLRGDT